MYDIGLAKFLIGLVAVADDKLVHPRDLSAGERQRGGSRRGDRCVTAAFQIRSSLR